MTGEDSPVVYQLATTKAEADAPLLGVAEEKALSETDAEDDGSSVVTEHNEDNYHQNSGSSEDGEDYGSDEDDDLTRSVGAMSHQDLASVGTDCLDGFSSSEEEDDEDEKKDVKKETNKDHKTKDQPTELSSVAPTDLSDLPPGDLLAPPAPPITERKPVHVARRVTTGTTPRAAGKTTPLAAAAVAPRRRSDPVAAEPLKAVRRAEGTKRNAGRSKISSGTKTYMANYKEECEDGMLRLGNVVPDFSAETTQGKMESFHTWKQGKWAVLFSHPSDFTPVCTTEIASMAAVYPTLKQRDCLLIGLSVDSADTHHAWMQDIEAHYQEQYSSGDANADTCPQLDFDFPMIADVDRNVSTKFGMLDTTSPQANNLTIRSVFIIDPDQRLRLNLSYPASVGRNVNEIVRCVQALQLSYQKSIATPEHWPLNHPRVKLEDGSVSIDFQGSVFLLPTVSTEQAFLNYPGYHTCGVPSQKKYLRLVQAKHVGVDISTVSLTATGRPGYQFQSHDNTATPQANQQDASAQRKEQETQTTEPAVVLEERWRWPWESHDTTTTNDNMDKTASKEDDATAATAVAAAKEEEPWRWPWESTPSETTTRKTTDAENAKEESAVAVSEPSPAKAEQPWRWPWESAPEQEEEAPGDNKVSSKEEVATPEQETP